MKTTDNIETKSVSHAVANRFVKKPDSSQTKLTFVQPGDQYEPKIDRVAEQVMSISDFQTIQPKYTSSITPWIQTQSCEEEEGLIQTKFNKYTSPEHVSDQTQAKIDSNKGLGNRLPDNTRSFMESRFNMDFSNVRIHNNPNAFQLSRELGAQAFTFGNDIYFNSGKYNPESSSGRHLLAHELTHVVQQQPQLFKSPEEESETTSTFEELETATKDVKKYMDYITKCAERSKKYGVPLPENIKKAAERIMEISQSITSKLNLVETAIETAQQGLDWAKGIYSVARDIASLDLSNRASLKALLKSIDTLNNASKPAQTWVESLGRKGGAAARFSFVFSVVVAQVEIGMKALSKGIEHAHAREARIRSRIATQEKSTERRIKTPPPPAFPLTEAEEKALWKAIKEQERILSEQNVENMFREDFRKKVFPRRDNYPKYRPQLLIQVREALLARLKKPQLLSEETAAKQDEEKWWECLTPSNEDARDYGGGIYLYPRKTSINDDDAFWEIHCFKEIDSPCPFFDALYDLVFEEFRRREYKNYAKKIFSR